MAKLNKRKKRQLQKNEQKQMAKKPSDNDLLRKLIMYGWMVLLLILPFLQAKTFYVHSAPKYFFSLSLLVVLLTMTIIGLLMQKLSWPKTRWSIAIGVYSLIFILATCFSIDIRTSIFGSYPDFQTGLIAYLLCLSFLFVVMTSRPAMIDIKKFLYLLATASLIISVHAILERYAVFGIGNPLAYKEARATGIFGNSDYTLSYMLFMFPLVIYTAASNRKLLKWIWIFPPVISALSIFLLFPAPLQNLFTALILNKIFLIIFLALATVTIYLAFARPRFTSLITGLGNKKDYLIFAAPVIILLILWYLGTSGAISRFLQSEANEQRFWGWRAGMMVGNDHKLIGSGPATISYFLPKIQKDHPSKSWHDKFTTNSVHNEFIDHYSTMGIPGVAAYVLLWGWLFWYAFSKKNLSSDKKGLLVTITVSLTLFLLFNQFMFSTAGTIFLPWLSAVIILFLTDNIEYKEQKLPSVLQIILSITGGLVGMTLLYFSIRYWVADYNLGKANKSQQYGFEYAQKSAELFPYIDTYQRYYGYNMYSDIFIRAASQNLTLSEENQKIVLEQSIDSLKKAVEMRPLLAMNWSYYGTVLLRMSQYDPSYDSLALEAYEKSLNLDAENNIYSYLQIADTYQQLKKFESAEKYLEYASRIVKDYSRYDFTIASAQYYYQKGDKTNALKKYSEAIQYTDNISAKEKLRGYIAEMQKDL